MPPPSNAVPKTEHANFESSTDDTRTVRSDHIAALKTDSATDRGIKATFEFSFGGLTDELDQSGLSRREFGWTV